MLYLKLFIEEYSVPLTPHPVPELYILDRGLRELHPVEAAHLQEYVLFYGAAPRPERARVAAGFLVYVVMKKVPVLRQEIRRGRLCIIRAEHGGYIRILRESLDDMRYSIAPYQHVGIDEQHYGRFGGGRPFVPGGCGAVVPAQLEYLDAEIFRYRGRAVLGAVIHYYGLELFVKRRLERVEAHRQIRFPVVNGYDD